MKTLNDEYGRIVKEREVGETFQDRNTTLMTIISHTCYNCFYYSNTGHCSKAYAIAGECSKSRRSDNIPIKFEEIKSNKKEIMRDVILIAGIPNPDNEKDYLKIQTVKSLKEILSLGLKEAKDLVDAIPSKIAERINAEKAEELTKAFEKEGMEIEVRNSLNNMICYKTKDHTKEIIATVKTDSIASEKEPHYWIMGTPDRGDDVYDLLHDKDSLLQSKTDVNKQMLENPSRLLLINSNHEINAIDIEDNASLVNLITKNWTELELPWKPEDKELVWAYDDRKSCRRIVTFYDIKNNCCFCPNGARNGYEYDHYEPFEGEWPQWAKDALVYLED